MANINHNYRVPPADMDLIGRTLYRHYGGTPPALKRDDPGVIMLANILQWTPDQVYMQMFDMAGMGSKPGSHLCRGVAAVYAHEARTITAV